MIHQLIFYLGKLFFVFKKREPWGTPQKIVVIKIGAMGDVLMSTPLVRSIKKKFPESKLIYVVGQWSKEILTDNPYIDKIISFDDDIIWKRKISEIINLINIIRREKADLGFILDRHYFASLFGFFCGIKFRVGYDRNGAGFANNANVKYGPVRHEIEYNLDLLGKVQPGEYLDKSMEVFLDSADNNFADDFIKKHGLNNNLLLGVMAGGAQNPGQTMYIRRWPIDHYIELIDRLYDRFSNVNVLLFGGPLDRKINNEIIDKCKTKPVNTAGELTIKQSIALMKKCSLFITHDSGPMHMAAAVGLPVISIFGPVHPKRKAPLGEKHTYIWKPDLPGALSDDEGKFPKDAEELDCMRQIYPDEIIKLIQNKYGNLLK